MTHRELLKYMGPGEWVRARVIAERAGASVRGVNSVLGALARQDVLEVRELKLSDRLGDHVYEYRIREVTPGV